MNFEAGGSNNYCPICIVVVELFPVSSQLSESYPLSIADVSLKPVTEKRVAYRGKGHILSIAGASLKPLKGHAHRYPCRRKWQTDHMSVPFQRL